MNDATASFAIHLNLPNYLELHPLVYRLRRITLEDRQFGFRLTEDEMKDLNDNEKNVLEMERVSQRFQNGVEILERETMRSFLVKSEPSTRSEPKSGPRLIIDDAISGSKMLITKSRAQLGEIDA